MTQLNSYLTAVARTVVPFIVGWLITLGIRHGVDLHGYAPLLTVGVGAVFYAVVHYLERFVNPAFGWLLSVAKAPSYPVKTAK